MAYQQRPGIQEYYHPPSNSWATPLDTRNVQTTEIDERYPSCSECCIMFASSYDLQRHTKNGCTMEEEEDDAKSEVRQTCGGSATVKMFNKSEGGKAQKQIGIAHLIRIKCVTILKVQEIKMETSTTDGWSENVQNSICISSDEYRSSSNVRDDSSYSVIQEEIRETSSGKSTIVNAIIGKKILPTGIEATTTRVCRVKYSKELKISTCSGTDKEYKHTISFTSPEEMADKLKFIAQTNDKNITYVDICMPIPFQQGNVAIVDTPGIGDIDQKEVATRMMDYIPNAVAFVFVINVGAAGGIQRDRIIPILEHVKNSLNEMVSFDQDDVIFLLNRWDNFLDDDDEEAFFQRTKMHISSIWKEVKSERILKLSMKKTFMEHNYMFSCFKEELGIVVEKNKEKRRNVHLRFLGHFIDECEKIVSPKLKFAKKNAKKSQADFEEALSKVSDLAKVWEEETLNLDENVNQFLDEVAEQLHRYIQNPNFKNSILQKVAKSWRLKLGLDLYARTD
uniref:Uncharacterized protein in xynA 3'region n=1 Tax=Magallana gigas TaxID=29159 RepID=K1R313_MAGGI